MKPQALVASAVTVQGYRKWIAELKTRYRATQIKAAISVNAAMYSYLQQVAEDNPVADFFRQVRAECGTLCWPEDIDLPPESVWDDVSRQQPI